MDRGGRSELHQRVSAFVDAVTGGDASLDEMTLTLSKALQPGLDVIGAMTELDALAGDCPTPTRDGVMRFLAEDAGFIGDEGDYHRWQNSCLDHVLAVRRGMPITLAVVAIEVARRVGVRLVGVGLPGHFVVGDPTDGDWFADPFHGTWGLSRSDCRELLRARGIGRWSEQFLEPTPGRHVVARMLNNLRVSCEGRDDPIRLAIVMYARQALPEFSDEHDDAIRALAMLN